MKTIFDTMYWLNEPDWGLEGETLWVKTRKDTDYWQRTHYGFRHDNAHAFVREVNGDFTLRGRFRFTPTGQYDQCGLLLRVNENCWLKCSVESEDDQFSRLGSVLTVHGYSDWATQDISSGVREITYTLEFKNSDFVLQYSFDDQAFHQMRVAHLDHQRRPILAGFYGCSPVGPGFRFEVSGFVLERLGKD